MRARQKQKGFTLIEIMVVVVIIGVLGGIVAVNVFDSADKASAARVKADLKSIESALKLFRLDNFRYPSTDQGLGALVNQPDNAKNWPSEGYLDKVPNDPWENPYVYIGPTGQSKYDLYSRGADNQDGGEGPDLDIHAKDL